MNIIVEMRRVHTGVCVSMTYKTIELRWIHTNYDNLATMEDTYFYALSGDSKLHYLGMTYDQRIQAEVKRTIYDFPLKKVNLSKETLSIWLGYIQKMDFKRISKAIVRDVEALLIRFHRPWYNVSSTKNYNGRDKMIVNNLGCNFLESYLRVNGDLIYTRP